jgi:hypothetical protein
MLRKYLAVSLAVLGVAGDVPDECVSRGIERGPPAQPAAAPTLSIVRPYGSLSITAATSGALFLDGKPMGELRHPDGQTEKKSVAFAYRDPASDSSGQGQYVRLPPDSKGMRFAITFSGREAIVYVDGKEVNKRKAFNIDPSRIKSTYNFLGKSQYPQDPYLNGALDPSAPSATAWRAPRSRARARGTRRSRSRSGVPAR